MAQYSTTKILGGETLNDLGLKHNERSDNYFGTLDQVGNDGKVLVLGANPGEIDPKELIAGAGINIIDGATSFTFSSTAPPGGPDRSIQLNNAGVLDGSANNTIDIDADNTIIAQKLKLQNIAAVTIPSSLQNLIRWNQVTAAVEYLPTEAWQNIAPTAPFTAGFETPQYRKNADGHVEFRGTIKNNAGGPGQPMFTVPGSHTPSVSRCFPACVRVANSIITLNIGNPGVVTYPVGALNLADEIDLCTIVLSIL